MFYSLASAERFDQALSFLTAVSNNAGHGVRVGLLNGGLTADQVAIAVGAGIAVESLPDDPGLAALDAASRLLYSKYRAADAWPLAERFLYCDCDCVFSRPGLVQWLQRGRHNQGLLLVRQPVTWFHLLRSHGIDDDQGLGLGLYEPVLCASMFGATRDALRDVDLGLRADIETAREKGWRHWADEAALSRLMLNQVWRAKGYPIATLPAVWHWHAGLGWTAQRLYLPVHDRAEATGPMIPTTPCGHAVMCLHFGADGKAAPLVGCAPELLAPAAYVGRDGQTYVAEGPPANPVPGVVIESAP